MKNVTFVNCTPHALILRPATGEDITLVPCGTVTRVDSDAVPCGTATTVGGNTFDIGKDVWGDVTDLPEPEDGKVFIVSGVVLSALDRHGIRRKDVVAPATGPRDGAIRNDRGFVVAVTRLKGL